MFGFMAGGGGPRGLPYNPIQSVYGVDRIQVNWSNSDSSSLVQARVNVGAVIDIGQSVVVWASGQTSTNIDIRYKKNGVVSAWVSTQP